MSSLRSLYHWAQTKIRLFESYYKNKSPKGKWEILRRFINFWLYCDGLAVLDRNYRVFWLTCMPGVLILDYFVLMVYTSYKFRTDSLRAIQTTCVLGAVIPVTFNSIFIANCFSNLFRFLFRLC